MKRLLHFNFKAIQSKKQSDALSLHLKMLVFILLITAFPFSKIFSNNLSVSIISGGVDLTNKTVTFDLSWDHSWRGDQTLVSANWDAAWVFVKWRDCSSADQFTHGLISTLTTDHNFNVLSGGTAYDPTKSDGTSGIDASPNNTGAMLRSFTNPFSGTISARVTLKVTNLPASGNLDLRVFGIEMVFVPQGQYVLGDGNGTNKSVLSFASAALGSSATSVASESAQTIYESASSGAYCVAQTCAVSAAFPKGFAAMYVMKYEISQGGYVDFLNASSPVVQTIHFPNQATNRHTITYTTGMAAFATTRPYRACNYLAWPDVGAYLAWAALRPLTELEYEKICRGSLGATPYESASQSITVTRAANISGVEDGTETITDAGANACAGTTAFGGSGDGGQGPLRGGIFATPTSSTRALTGGSFYGIMELSGNVDELYISAIAGVGYSSNGLALGAGTVDDISGHFTTFGWPSALTPNYTLYDGTQINNIIHRGGNWNTTNLTGAATVGQTYLNVSDRQGGSVATRSNTSGGRGGRAVQVTSSTAPGTTTLSYTGSIQTFTVPAGVTSLTINAKGAKGGGTAGSLGASMTGTFNVIPGQVLKVLVGQAGTNSTGNSATGGGGGGSYVTDNSNIPVIIAGGGGGISGAPGSATTTAGGTGPGTGGGGGTSSTCSGGGGGLTGNGANGGCGGGQGKSFTNGGAAAAAGTSGGAGGFGGGAGSEWSCCGSGGGGGGYNGGGYSGGGGSFPGGTNQTNTAGGGPSGNGTVIFTW